MSLLTLEQVLCDSEKLAVRLQEDDNTADDLLSQARCVYKQIDAMKQYSDDTMELNELARQRPHSVLVAGIQQESRRLRELQQENRELRAALEDHQNALEVIMSKYRQHVTHLVQASRGLHHHIPPQLQIDSQYAQLMRQSDKMSEMAAVMRVAAQTDEKDSLHDIEVISKLATENQGLRELLNISVKYGSYNQTDEPEKTDDGKTPANESAIESSRITAEAKPTSSELKTEKSEAESSKSSEGAGGEPSTAAATAAAAATAKSTEVSKQTPPPAAVKDESFWS